MHLKYNFLVPGTAAEVFDKICLVSKWWATDVEGALKKLYDEFTVHFGESFVKMEVTEMIHEKKISWLVKHCYWSFLENKTEWNGTKIAWEITPNGDLTQLRMMHVGLDAEAECYAVCKEGWAYM